LSVCTKCQGGFATGTTAHCAAIVTPESTESIALPDALCLIPHLKTEEATIKNLTSFVKQVLFC